MKTTLHTLAAVCFAAFILPCHALQLNWGSPGATWVVDSDGDGVDDNYVFELGAFPLGFDPGENDPSLWFENWMVFDAAIYNPMLGLFTSEVSISNQVTSSSTMPNVSNESFSGLTAYLWIRDSNEPIPGSEWLLVRADNWTFPTIGEGCCDTGTLEWSISDLDPGDVPGWGWQNDDNVPSGTEGPGEFSESGLNARDIIAPSTTRTPALQTATFLVPEPSSALLLLLGASGMVLVRRRHAVVS